MGKTICVREGKFRKLFVNFYEVSRQHFEEGSSYENYLLVWKNHDFSSSIEKLNLHELKHPDSLEASLLKSFPLIITLSDSSELKAYSMDLSKLDFIN